MRIYDPLPKDHPLVVDGRICGLCQSPFRPGQRVTLVPVRPASPLLKAECVPALPLHAVCVFKGMLTAKGTIRRIKDGDASPYPVETDKGQFTLQEVGLA